MSASFITPGHVRAYQMVRSQLYDNVTLASCLINGEPGVAIVLIDDVGEGKLGVMPLFVGITDSMALSFVGFGEEVGGGGGGPRRGFQAAKAATDPKPAVS